MWFDFAGERGQVVLDLGHTYGDGGAPVEVLVRKRPGQYVFSDAGRAVEEAGRPDGWLEVARGIVREHDLNVNRRGVVFVPAVERSELSWLTTLAERVADTSVAVYEALLELDG